MNAARSVSTLAAVLLTLVVLPTSVTGSAVVLPHIGAETGASLDALQWVVHAYNLTFACFMLACGSLADLIGRRRVFLVGAVVFASASVASAVATDIHLLDAARGIAGAGAAALLTSGSSLVATSFEGAARTRAFAAVGIATGSGLALGAMLAGVLADTSGWRSFFAAHALLMLPVLCAVPAMRESRGSSATGVDWPGTAAFVGGTFLLMLGVVEGPQWGWGSPGVLGLLAGAALLLVLFALVERRRRDPMLDLGLLRNAKFVALCSIPVVATLSFVILLPLLPNYLLVANRSTSREAGSTMLLMTLPILVAPLLAGRLIRWGVSTRAVFAASLLCLTAGTGWLAAVLHPGIGVAELAGPLIALGVGLGLNFGLVDGAALAAVDVEKTGTAAGLLNTVRLGSEALAIAAAGSALVNLTQQSLGRGLWQLPAYRGTPEELANDVNAGDLAGPMSALPADVQQRFFAFVADGFTDSWQVLLWTCAAICALLSAAIAVVLREPEVAPEVAAAR
ncbi:Major Facilitator Superfamily protein [Saccharopolyspora antimicrobica]|uniref:MFS transporter n=1 Tax=Saccharopolyspora antimicrobica TaxID=455193 RepID=A0A1I4QDH1_9PSEU|nr:MFS transporter [Saccharopolyspora antimicrobica]RKT84889.1 MFS transporter [Saccharopolyspora antimicrobica]SFM38152.1 Major Facilitator Superfamily protein [Saccharopolyspora antimicrobica]